MVIETEEKQDKIFTTLNIYALLHYEKLTILPLYYNFAAFFAQLANQTLHFCNNQTHFVQA